MYSASGLRVSYLKVLERRLVSCQQPPAQVHLAPSPPAFDLLCLSWVHILQCVCHVCICYSLIPGPTLPLCPPGSFSRCPWVVLLVLTEQGNSYQVEKWVRKMCRSGDFLVRI
jgi:hypothetical protein